MLPRAAQGILRRAAASNSRYQAARTVERAWATVVIPSFRAVPMKGLASVGALLDQIADEIPTKEALQYPQGKEKWTRAEIRTAAHGLAAGFLDLQLQPGDTIAAWLPADSMDLHVTQLASAKAGLTLAIIDYNSGKEGIEKMLADTAPKILIFEPFRDNTDNIKLLESIIPELEKYDSSYGITFRSIKFPNLRYLVHTGLDTFDSVENIRHIFLPMDPKKSPVPAAQATVTDSTPLFLPVEADGTKGSILSHAQVLKSNAWPVVCSLINKQFVKIG